MLLEWTAAQIKAKSSWTGWLVAGYCYFTTHRPGTWLWHRVVVGVPLLGLPVDLSVAAAEGSLHLGHGEGAHRWAAWGSFIPVNRQKQSSRFFKGLCACNTVAYETVVLWLWKLKSHICTRVLVAGYSFCFFTRSILSVLSLEIVCSVYSNDFHMKAFLLLIH